MIPFYKTILRLIPIFALMLPSMTLHAQCAPGEIAVRVILNTDNYPLESNWNITDLGGNVVQNGTGFNLQLHQYITDLCLPANGCYTFHMNDTYGDGICCAYGAGSYALIVAGDTVAQGGDFDHTEITAFNCVNGQLCSQPETINAPGTFTTTFDDHWYAFTAPDLGNYTISTCGINACDTKIWVYDNCGNIVADETDSTTIAYDDNGCGLQSTLSLTLGINQTVYIRIGDANDDCTGDNIAWNLIYNGPCAPGEHVGRLTFLSDNYPQESSWRLTDFYGNVLYAGSGYNQQMHLYTTAFCLPDTCLIFQFMDSFGDGICCGYGTGYYVFTIDGDTVALGGNFDFIETSTFNCPAGITCTEPDLVQLGQYTTVYDDHWYEFTPQDTGSYTITTCGLDTCDTQIWIYGSCPPSIDETMMGTLAYDDNGGGCGQQAQVTLALPAGATIFIRIGDALDACDDNVNWQIIYNGPIVGCMDPAACNFNPLATVPDTNCVYPGDPDCTDGPDLLMREDVLRNSIQVDVAYNATDPCLINEQCLTGFGIRQLVRFTTHIQNIGQLDYYIGQPNVGNPTQFILDGCHNHYHYVGYAEYLLFDTAGTQLPAGYKNGFCVLDLECSGGGTAQYGCGNMGISHGCGDIYDRGLPCQWMDVTNVPDGRYTLVVRVNWDQSPDALGRLEMDYENNWAQVCLVLDRSNGTLVATIDPNCPVFVDCAGVPYGNAQPDCNGVCGGPSLMGDLDASGMQDLPDAIDYMAATLDENLAATPCNDLYQDGNINVYDAALLNSCLVYGAGHQHQGGAGGPHNHCDFPAGALNNADTVGLRITNVDFVNRYIDIAVLNPDVHLKAYQFRLSGVELLSAQNAADPAEFPVTIGASTAHSTVAALSYQDSSLDRSMTPQPLCRVFFTQTTGPEICIDSIYALVNKDYFLVEPRIDGGCVPVPVVGINNPSVSYGVQVSPNPFNNETRFTFHNPTSESLRLEILDAVGRVVRTAENLSSDFYVLQRDGLASGQYLYRLSGKNGVQTGKVVISNQ